MTVPVLWGLAALCSFDAVFVLGLAALCTSDAVAWAGACRIAAKIFLLGLGCAAGTVLLGVAA